jgi:hypothetical protein
MSSYSRATLRLLFQRNLSLSSIRPQSNGDRNVGKSADNDQRDIDRVVVAVEVFLCQDVHWGEDEAQRARDGHCEAVESTKGDESAKASAGLSRAQGKNVPKYLGEKVADIGVEKWP